MMKTFIALDTSTENCSCAVWHQGKIFSHAVQESRAQAQHCLSLIEACLADAKVSLDDCEAVAFGQGPGSFTGLRIGASCAQALAFAKSLPVIPISSLQALAQQAYRVGQADQVFTALDARMGEVYSGWWTLKDEVMLPAEEEQVQKPETIRPVLTSALGLGNVWGEYPALATQLSLTATLTAYPQAQDLAILALKMGKPVDPAEGLPHYIRNNVTH